MFNKFKQYVEERWGLITTWKCWYRWWSNQLVVIGSLLVSLAPDISTYIMWVVNAYGELPMGIQLAFPEGMVRNVGIVVILLSIPAKFVKQKKLPQE